MQLEHKAVVGITLRTPRRERAILITTQRDGLGGVGVTAAHAVATNVERLKRRLDVLVPTAQQTEVGTRHQHQCPTTIGVGQRGVGTGLELQLPVLNPAVQFFLVGLKVALGQGLPILLAEQTCRRSGMEAQRERATTASVQRVVDAVTRQGEAQHDGVGHTIVHIIKVFPVFQTIPLVAHVGHQREIVVRPLQTFTEAHRHTCHLQVFVRVIGVLIVVVAVVVVTVVTTIVIVHVVILHVTGVLAVVVRRVDTCLAAVEARHRQRVWTLATKPRVKERHAIGLVVLCVGLRTDGERLTVALRDDAFEARRMEQILDGEVGELQTQFTQDTRLAPARREFNLVVGL